MPVGSASVAVVDRAAPVGDDDPVHVGVGLDHLQRLGQLCHYGVVVIRVGPAGLFNGFCQVSADHVQAAALGGRSQGHGLNFVTAVDLDCCAVLPGRAHRFGQLFGVLGQVLGAAKGVLDDQPVAVGVSVGAGHIRPGVHRLRGMVGHLVRRIPHDLVQLRVEETEIIRVDLGDVVAVALADPVKRAGLSGGGLSS